MSLRSAEDVAMSFAPYFNTDLDEDAYISTATAHIEQDRADTRADFAEKVKAAVMGLPEMICPEQAVVAIDTVLEESTP